MKIVSLTVFATIASGTTFKRDTACAAEYQQCGGKQHTGATCCQSGLICNVINEYYSQCNRAPLPPPSTTDSQPPRPTTSPNPPASGKIRPGTVKKNFNPPFAIKTDGINVNSAVTIDANWRWVHDKDYRNCYDGKWGSQCQDPATCAAQCVLEGVEEADWKSTYGITFPDEKSVQLNLVTGTNIGSRLYLLDSTKNSYYGFNPMNREFHFTVDSSKLGCGLNGALYFVTMDLTSEDTTAAGPAYGVGYADAQCPADIKYINGIPNVSNPPLQICSPEMDLWEANKFSNAFTPHPCATPLKATVCNGLECGNGSDRQNGLCDKDGADYNPYRGGNTTFYGPSSTNVIDSTKPIKVITQFITKNNADDGDLVKIQRFYQQGGKTFYGGMMTDTFNDLQKDLFKDPNTFKRLGGMKQMGVSLRNKMVLVMSIWGDTVTNMEWLDSSVPAGSKEPGHVRGVCPPGKTYQDSIDPKASVTYSDIQLNKIVNYQTAN